MTLGTAPGWMDGTSNWRTREQPMANAQLTARPEPAATSGTGNGKRPRLKPARHFWAPDRGAGVKGGRETVPLSVHAEWAPAPDRRDPVELIEDQAASRVAELVP